MFDLSLSWTDQTDLPPFCLVLMSNVERFSCDCFFTTMDQMNWFKTAHSSSVRSTLSVGDVAYQHLPIWIYSNRSWSSHTESLNKEQVLQHCVKVSPDTGSEPGLITNCSQHCRILRFNYFFFYLKMLVNLLSTQNQKGIKSDYEWTLQRGKSKTLRFHDNKEEWKKWVPTFSRWRLRPQTKPEVSTQDSGLCRSWKKTSMSSSSANRTTAAVCLQTYLKNQTDSECETSTHPRTDVWILLLVYKQVCGEASRRCSDRSAVSSALYK